MSRFTTRLQRLEQQFTRPAGYQPEAWIPPTREAVAAFLAPVLPIYARSGLLEGEPLDEAGILDACNGVEWPEANADMPASIQGHQLLQAVLARCGLKGATT